MSYTQKVTSTDSKYVGLKEEEVQLDTRLTELMKKIVWDGT